MCVITNLHSNITTFRCIGAAIKYVCKILPGFQYMMRFVTKAITFIWWKGLNHRQFQNFLNELGAECSDLLFYSEVQ